MKTANYTLRLRALKKAMRETTHAVKPMVTTDRRKQTNKMACRKFNFSGE